MWPGMAIRQKLPELCAQWHEFNNFWCFMKFRLPTFECTRGSFSPVPRKFHKSGIKFNVSHAQNVCLHCVCSQTKSNGTSWVSRRKHRCTQGVVGKQNTLESNESRRPRTFSINSYWSHLLNIRMLGGTQTTEVCCLWTELSHRLQGRLSSGRCCFLL